MTKNTLLALPLSCALLGALLLVPGSLAAANWYQVNKDGFFGNPSGSMIQAKLLTFDSELLAYDPYGLYRMESSVCAVWKKLYTPVKPGNWTIVSLGGYLLLSDQNKDLWILPSGSGISSSSWKKVTFTGLPGGVKPTPMAIFKGKVYGRSKPLYSTTFDIWRSSDLGKSTMSWTKVVPKSFGDSGNHDLGFLIEYKNKILAVTTQVREGAFGYTWGYGKGVEVWASSSGNAGTWTQVNKDGFGTEVVEAGKTVRINCDVGSWAVFKGYLYIGTKSHSGGEVWRYDGTGVKGWKAVTAPDAAPHPIFSIPRRNEAMTIYKNELYVAEGFPTGILWKYNGSTWTRILGPNPFHPDNGGFSSALTYKNRLYVVAIHDMGKTKGDQVWAYPHPLVAWFACQDLGWLEKHQTLLAINPGDLKLASKVGKKSSSGAGGPGTFDADLFQDGELVMSDTVDMTEVEEASVEFAFETDGSDHVLTLVANQQGAGDEDDGANNVQTLYLSGEDLVEAPLALRLGTTPSFLVDGDQVQVSLAGRAAGDCQPQVEDAELSLEGRTILTLNLSSCPEGDTPFLLHHTHPEPLPSLPYLEIRVRNTQERRLLASRWFPVKLQDQALCRNDDTALCLWDGRFEVVAFSSNGLPLQVEEGSSNGGVLLGEAGGQVAIDLFVSDEEQGEVGLALAMAGEGGLQVYVKDKLSGRVLDYWKPAETLEKVTEDLQAFSLIR